MNPFLISIIGSVIRTALAVASGAAAITAPSIQSGTSIPMTDDMQLLMSAIGSVITLLWSMYQKKKSLAPVEERAV